MKEDLIDRWRETQSEIDTMIDRLHLVYIVSEVEQRPLSTLEGHGIQRSVQRQRQSNRYTCISKRALERDQRRDRKDCHLGSLYPNFRRSFIDGSRGLSASEIQKQICGLNLFLQDKGMSEHHISTPVTSMCGKIQAVCPRAACRSREWYGLFGVCDFWRDLEFF